MNDIERALDKGTDVGRLRDASHELGHGLAFLAAGFRPKHLELHSGYFGGAQGGLCRLGAHTVTDRDAKAYLTALLAGHAAAARFGHLYLGMSRRDAERWGAEGTDTDYALFGTDATWWAEHHGIKVSPSWAYERAARLVDQRGGRLDRLAARLAKSGRLPGGVL